MKYSLAYILLVVLLSVNAFGWGGKINSPQIGPPGGLDDTQEGNVVKLVTYMKNDLEFIEGSFINEFSSQRFGASPEQLIDYIALLKHADLWNVKIRFRDFGEQDSAFILSQSSPDSLHLTINSGREDFLLKDFVKFFPEITAPTRKGSVPQNQH